MRPLLVYGTAVAAVAGLVGHARAQTCVVSDELLVLQVDVAQAQLAKYSDQLALWTRIADDLAPPDTVAQTLQIQVDPSYLASMSDTNGDGVLTPAEIAADPEAAALAASLQAQICESLQLSDCSQVQITGIGGATPTVQSNFDIDVTSEYQAALASADTDGDGNLSPEELAADPTSAAMVAALQESICDSLPACSDPSTISISQVANVAQGTGEISNNLQLSVTDEFHAHLMEADTNGDGQLEPEELAAHPTAAAIVEAMQQSICDSIPACTDPTTISIDGITSNADGNGRRMLRSADELVSVTLAQTAVQSFGRQSAFRDCVLTESEIADSSEATSFANAFGRVHGSPVTALRVPGCATTRSSGTLTQKIMSERRVTMGWDHWTAMGGNELPMTPEMIQANTGATALARDFATAACTEFGLVAQQCPSIEVSLLYPERKPDGSVEVRSAVRGHRDHLLLIAEVESAGR